MRRLPFLLFLLTACDPTKIFPDEEADADTDADSDTDTDTDSDADTDSDTDADTDSDTDADTDADTDTDPGCDIDFTVTLPDGSTTTLDCTSAAAEATFEFDPDEAPAVRSVGLRFAAGESDTADCYLDVDLLGVCGAGWYEVGAATSGVVATLDCSGVADEVENIYPLTGGYVYLSEISGGDEPGEPGSTVDLVAAGNVSARSADGLAIEGDFRVVQAVVPNDVEGGECLVEDTDPSLRDRDLDGWEGPAGSDDDCDDTDASVYPGAYDRPDDGVDGDCDGEDRTFDGVVLDPGVRTTEIVAYTAAGAVGLDVALVLDTTCSMTSTLAALDVPTIASEASGEGDARWSFSTYDDYAYGSYGSTSYSDLPFDLRVQTTDDVDAVQAAIDGGSLHGGADGPESGMEALYQALTGAGYDQDCDGALDANTDVPPFIASTDDAFGGDVPGTYAALVSGTGTGGGYGYRSEGQPVVVLITDNYMRDPDGGYGSPGGCPDDAGSSAVADAAVAHDAWIVGIAISSLPVAQFAALADATGHYVDIDGDGRADDAPVYTATSSDLNEKIGQALDDVAAAAMATAEFDEVEIEVAEDPYGVVSAITPDSFTDVTAGDPLPFDLELLATGTDEPIVTTVVLNVYGDGSLIDTIEVDIEIAPS